MNAADVSDLWAAFRNSSFTLRHPSLLSTVDLRRSDVVNRTHVKEGEKARRREGEKRRRIVTR